MFSTTPRNYIYYSSGARHPIGQISTDISVRAVAGFAREMRRATNKATEAAAELDLTLVIFTGEAARTLGPQLRDTDVWVPLPGTRESTLFAIAWLALEGLCAAVDTHLLGEDA